MYCMMEVYIKDVYSTILVRWQMYYRVMMWFLTTFFMQTEQATLKQMQEKFCKSLLHDNY